MGVGRANQRNWEGEEGGRSKGKEIRKQNGGGGAAERQPEMML